MNFIKSVICLMNLFLFSVDLCSYIATIDSKNLDTNSFILDVRTKEEVKEKHLLELPYVNEDSSKINVKEFIKKYKLEDEKTTINILCKGGYRATNVAEQFYKAGYKNVRVIKGGIDQAEKDGIKVGKE